jgi:hypothetical protein
LSPRRQHLQPVDRQRLLARLDAIGRSLAQLPHALALLGLGSVGLELDRLDEHSDLDFFAIVEAGHKRALIDDLGWLAAVHPIAYAFQNTPDGYKVLFADGIFCEFAVFEPQELAGIAFAPGRVVWQRAGAPAALGQPPAAPQPPTPTPRDLEHALGEALTNLYVGLLRDRRGEKLSAARFIQGYAVDRLMTLAEVIEPAQPGPRDPFAQERRFEQRHPALAREAAAWMQGYARNRESALAILAFLEKHFSVDAAMGKAIREAAA